MTEVIGVRFKKVGKVYYFDPSGLKVEKDQPVIVETARGAEYGEAVMGNEMVPDESIVKPLKKVLRLATPADRKTMEENLVFEEKAFRTCEEKILRHGLEMKLVAVEYTFDRSKILFYFSADGRVDFRDLVKDLAGVFRTRIELRQIGVRDEAKMIGGLGICGRPLCCSTFLDDFQPVSINMAKDQGLSLNPTKISGTCGRLMCCLKYENEAYQELLRTTPPNESLVDTPQGRGTIIETSLLKGCCKVRLQNNPDTPVNFRCDECTVLRAGREQGPRQQEPKESKDAKESKEVKVEKVTEKPVAPTLVQILEVAPLQEDISLPEDKSPNNRRRRDRYKKPAAQNGQPQQKPAVEQPKPAPRAAEESAPRTDGEGKSQQHNRNRHRNRRRHNGHSGQNNPGNGNA